MIDANGCKLVGQDQKHLKLDICTADNKHFRCSGIAFNVENENDLAQLQCTAEVTSGKFINATTNAELFNSMQELIKPHLEVEAILYNKFMLQ